MAISDSVERLMVVERLKEKKLRDHLHLRCLTLPPKLCYLGGLRASANAISAPYRPLGCGGVMDS